MALAGRHLAAALLLLALKEAVAYQQVSDICVDEGETLVSWVNGAILPVLTCQAENFTDSSMHHASCDTTTLDWDDNYFGGTYDREKKLNTPKWGTDPGECTRRPDLDTEFIYDSSTQDIYKLSAEFCINLTLDPTVNVTCNTVHIRYSAGDGLYAFWPFECYGPDHPTDPLTTIDSIPRHRLMWFHNMTGCASDVYATRFPPTPAPTNAPTPAPTNAPTPSPTLLPTMSGDFNGTLTTKSVGFVINISDSRQVALEAMNATVEYLDALGDQPFLVDYTEDITLDADSLAATGADEAALLAAVRLARCGPDLAEYCAIERVSGPGFGRRELAGAVVFRVSFAVLGEAFKEIRDRAPALEAALAAELGMDVDLLALEAPLIEVDLLFDDDADPALVLERAAGIAYTIEQIMIALDLTESEVRMLEVDLCESRSCSGRGTCDPDTGICDCVGDWWGTNCETPCVCDNGGYCLKKLCRCPWPYFGRTCERANGCSAASCDEAPSR